ncbi:hypothetical protein [Streptomyces sp. KL2]|uniref:hypothetical protein n=1 Tax=Streptomyces sp. KL2 TaxID=3050126 RepID=UPI00397C6016
MPDYFDRLLTRHIPAARGAGAAPGRGPGVPVRVRPRLPEPYERVEALRGAPWEPEEANPFLPPAPRPAVRPGDDRAAVRHEREIRTEHRTVVRTGPVPDGDRARPPAAARPVQPQPARRATASPPPAAVPAPPRGGRTAPARTEREPLPAAVPAPVPRDAGPAPVPTVAVPLRPAGARAAREAARAAGGRRRSRTAERTVHVRIGRLEVSAAPPAAGPAGAGRPQRPARPAPALSLADYLAGGERRD